MSPSAAPTRYAIGVYELDTQQKIVFRHRNRVSLTPKAVDLLIVLASRAGEVVSKSELMEKVWPDAIVDEGTLSKLGFNVRKELPDLEIQTLPTRGYLLSIPTTPAPRRRPPVTFAVLAAILVGLLALGLLFRPRG